jgi:HD-GYP domain-containing protein (c-di-GMP phosphodiesterase class II)
MDEKVDLARENTRLREQLQTVTQIGTALSSERDLTSLLRTILTKARELTHADAGSLYLVEGDKRDKLRFVLAQNDSLEVPFVEMVLDISSKTIVGHVATARETLNLDDVYQLDPACEFSFSTKFDESVGYRCKSMLVIPMIDHRDRVIGCLQLINRKPTRELRLESPQMAEEQVLIFDDDDVRLMESLASQSAVAIDKAQLIQDLQSTFEGLVYASVVAIESRDPTTKGHSERVAKLSVELAKAVSDTGEGKFAPVAFTDSQLRELRFASLLHDFGKVGVRERVLVKAKKLYPWNLEQVRLRFACAVREREAEILRDLVRRLCEAKPPLDPRPFVEAAEETIRQETDQLLKMLELVKEANEPKILADGSEAELQHVGERSFLLLDGTRAPLLEPDEVENLSIPRGSLNREERLEIESHVQHTYRFLTRIPWTEDLHDLPRIAGSHHEKLDGSGYPHGLDDADIPPQSKIMAVADIFDALTAWDRPYKKAVPLQKALAILEAEASRNKIEPQLVEMFRARKIFRAVGISG